MSDCPKCGYDYPDGCDASCDYKHPMQEWISVKDGMPKEDGRYFVLVDFEKTVISSELKIVRRTGWAMVSSFTVDKGWLGEWPQMTITHWMEVPTL